MGWRFRRSLKITPGLHLNLSRSGLSLTAGVRGAHVTTRKRGTYASVGLPGTGLSYRDRISGAPIQPNPSRVPLRGKNGVPVTGLVWLCGILVATLASLVTLPLMSGHRSLVALLKWLYAVWP